MNFSNNWHSLWPIGAVPLSPSLLSGHETAPLGPLLFRRSHPSRIILASSSLALRIPPASPSTILPDINSVCRCPATGFLLSSSDQYNLAADIALSFASSCFPLDSFSRNNLHALPCRDGSSLLLFFPTGENADEIGFLCLRFQGENLNPDVGVDLDGDVFKQKEGLEHPRHRIQKMSVIQTQAIFSLPKSTCITEGFLMVTTLYSVNWFRVETRVSEKGTVRHLLIPLAKKGFQQLVVDACLSPHFSEESAVLLNSGKLLLFNVLTKRDIKLSVFLGANGDSRFLGCKFGAQPWAILIASSTAIALIDLRPNRINEQPKILARVKLPDFLSTLVSVEEENDTFQAFCWADYSSFHFTAVTKKLLLLFDTREPMVPILTWVHGIEHPTYVSMFRLSELRPSVKFKLASESGFVILVGSFWKNEFKLFCYGSSDRGALRSSFYAWELPSSLSLSDRQCRSADELVGEMMLKETVPNQEMLLRLHGVTGFCVVPNNLLKSKTEHSGFLLIRLSVSGKLEILEYHACDSLSDKHICDGADMREAEDLTIYNVHEGVGIFNQFLFFKLFCLYAYMNGDLSTMLTNLYLDLSHKAKNHKPLCDDLREIMSSKVHSSNLSISNFLNDASIPTNVFEVASRRLLTTLKPNILTMAFTKFGKLFTGHAETSFLPLEFPNCLPHHQFTPFFVNIPLNRSENLSSKVLDAEAIVGPVLPLPVLLVLQQMGMDMKELFSKEELVDDLSSLECKNVLENVYPETSIANCCGFSQCGASQELLHDKQFLVCQPTLRGYGSIFKDASSTFLSKEEESKMNYLSKECPVFNQKDEFTTFICGISVKDCKADHGHKVVNCEDFDFSPVKLDFEPLDALLKPTEQKVLESMKRQASNWLKNFKLYQDFCISSKIQKSV